MADDIAPGPDGNPPLGLVMGPHPPCTICGSDGWPADLELTYKTRQAWLCIDCWFAHIPEAVQRARPVRRQEALAARMRPWTRSSRVTWKRRERADAPDQPTLLLP